MPVMRVSRSLLLTVVLIAGMLVGCASNPPTPLPPPTNQPKETLLTLPALLSEPQRWSGQRITLIAPIKIDDQSRVLLPNLSAAPTMAQGIWLAEPLSPGVQEKLKNRAGILKMRGVLSPPGAYGQEQQYTYQFSPEQIDAITPERTTVVNLADNPRALDGILLQVEGILLLQRDAALLADRVSEGGVPTANARLVKLPTPPADAPWLAELTQSGDVRWGKVRITGWWQAATMTPFSTEVLQEPSVP